MKGNDGKGRRNALMRKLTCIVLGFGGLLTVLSVLGIGNHSNRLLMHHDDQLPKTNMRRLVSQSVSRFWFVGAPAHATMGCSCTNPTRGIYDNLLRNSNVCFVCVAIALSLS